METLTASMANVASLEHTSRYTEGWIGGREKEKERGKEWERGSEETREDAENGRERETVGGQKEGGEGGGGGGGGGVRKSESVKEVESVTKILCPFLV